MKSLPNAELMEQAAQEIRGGRTVKLRLVGRSMYPFLREKRDSVIVGPFTPEELRSGAIVLAQVGRHWLLHRIVGIENGALHLRGDANCRRSESVAAADIVGILRSIERKGRTIRCDTPSWRIRGQLWMWGAPLRSVLLKLLRLFD